MLFFKLQVSGDYFTQLKAVEILHLLLSSNDIGPEYLQLVAFIYPLIEVANLKVLFLKIEDNDQFFEVFYLDFPIFHLLLNFVKYSRLHDHFSTT